MKIKFVFTSFLKFITFLFLFVYIFQAKGHFFVSKNVSLIFLNNRLNNVSLASNYTTFKYAKIENGGVYFYKSASSQEMSNAYFELPQSYYVLLLSNIDDNFYKAQYKDIVGYVLKDKVTPVAEKPQNPYPTINFWVYASNGTDVYFSSFTNLDQKTNGKVEVMQSLEYYGEMIGDEFVKNRGYIWLYCKTGSVNGYLYKGLCDLSESLKPNTESFTRIDTPFKDTDNSFLYNLVNMGTFEKIFLTLLVTLPSVLLIFLMFRPFKIKTTPIEKIKRKKVKNKTINRIQKIIDDEQI